MAMLLRLKSINFSLYISLFSTALLFFFDSLYFQMHIFLSDDVMFSFFSQRRFFSFWSFFSLIKDRFHLDSDFFPFTVQQFFPEFTGFSVINDERTVYHHHYYYYSACIGDFRFGYLRLLFLICCSYRSVSSLALRSPFVFNLFFTVCFDLLYFYVASLSLSLCVFTFCFVFFFLYILFVPQSLFSPLSFSTSYRNKDIILLLLLFVHIILFLTWLQIPILWIPVHQVFFRWIWIPQQLLLIGSFFSLVSLRNLI